MFDLGTQELILIFIVAFLVFGPKKLPELGRTLGKGLRDLKTAMRGVTASFEDAGSEVTEELKQAKSGLEESVYKSIESHISKEEETGEETEEADASPEDKETSKPVKEDVKEKTDQDG